jgi:anti-sigma factor RsiW
MCETELLLAYLYDELPLSDRQAFDRHLATCATCREEVTGLRGTRTHLTSWAPPEPDLGFQVVRNATPAAPLARWWRASPAWGLAAAALLVVAVSAAIANVQVKFGPDGVVVSTGWNRAAPAGAVPVLAAGASISELQRVEGRIAELEGRLAARQAATLTPVTVTRMSDAEIVRLVRQAVSDSELRQQGVLARQILQVSRDTAAARQTDFDRLLTAFRQQQATIFDTAQKQRALEDHFMRVGLQR